MRIASNEVGIQPAALYPSGPRSVHEFGAVESPWKSTKMVSPGIRSREHLRELLERERARTDRTGCEFSLVLFGKRDSGNGSQLAPEKLAQAVRRRARGTDEVGFASDDVVCALLTGTSQEGALQFAQGVADAVGVPTGDVVDGVYSYPSPHLQLSIDSLIHQYLDKPVGDHRASPHIGTGNGNGHANGNGHRHDNGNGSGNGNGNGHAQGHGNGNGHVVPLYAEALSKNASAGRTMPLEGIGLPQSPVNGPLQELFAGPMPLGKRVVDVAAASVLLLTLAPLMIAVAVGVKLTSRGSVIFRQVRAGRAGRPFVLYKFRSMTVEAELLQDALRSISEQDGPAFKIKADPRVTPVGRFIRKTSLDELPQLWNVLKGDMSLVGPRPLPWKEACACEPWQRRRLDATPGITCIWQITGRSSVSFAQWMRMDIAYIRSRSVFRDVLLLVKTVPAVLFRRGAS